MTPSVDIVVVNWNAGPLLAGCLGSIPAALGPDLVLGRVVVVDNGSSDGSADDLPDLGLPLTVIRNPSNLGFGAACNQGALDSEADYLLFLNPDTRLFEDSLRAPLAHMQAPENAALGACGIQLVDEEGRVARSCARFPRPATFFWIATGLDRLLPGLALGYRMGEWDHGSTRDVDHVMGAFYLVRRELFARLGGFDRDYFVYFEDLDLSRRLARAGAGVRYLATAQAFHLGGGTSRRVRARRLAYFLAGKLTYVRKHHRPWRLAAAAATFLVEPVARCLGALVARSPADVAATLRAYGLLVTGRVRPGADHG